MSEKFIECDRCNWLGPTSDLFQVTIFDCVNYDLHEGAIMTYVCPRCGYSEYQNYEASNE